MNKQQLASKIWESANRMRSKIEANEYKDYILGFIFYKFLSDKEVKYLKENDWTDEYLPEPTEEDIAFWSEVWETHRRITGTATKPKTRNQIISWLQAPHSDSAEYKMWGNGVALPNVFFVLAGIVWSTQIASE